MKNAKVIRIMFREYSCNPSLSKLSPSCAMCYNMFFIRLLNIRLP